MNVTAARLSRFADLALDKSNHTLWFARKEKRNKETAQNLTALFFHLNMENKEG